MTAFRFTSALYTSTPVRLYWRRQYVGGAAISRAARLLLQKIRLQLLPSLPGSRTRMRWLLLRRQRRRPHDSRVLLVRAIVNNGILIMVLYIYFFVQVTLNALMITGIVVFEY